MMAPVLLVMAAVAPTCTWLRLIWPLAVRVARPLVPRVVTLVPLAMASAAPAIRVIWPPVLAPPDVTLPA